MRHTDPMTRDRLKESVNLTLVPLIVKIGYSHLTTRELLNLKVGDVLTLDTGVNDDLEVFVESHKLYGGRPGTRSKKKAVMITRQYEKMTDELQAQISEAPPLEV